MKRSYIIYNHESYYTCSLPGSLMNVKFKSKLIKTFGGIILMRWFGTRPLKHSPLCQKQPAISCDSLCRLYARKQGQNKQNTQNTTTGIKCNTAQIKLKYFRHGGGGTAIANKVSNSVLQSATAGRISWHIAAYHSETRGYRSQAAEHGQSLKAEVKILSNCQCFKITGPNHSLQALVERIAKGQVSKTAW